MPPYIKQKKIGKDSQKAEKEKLEQKWKEMQETHAHEVAEWEGLHNQHILVKKHAKETQATIKTKLKVIKDDQQEGDDEDDNDDD